MSLIVEDGSMPQGANTYASVADSDDWHGRRGSSIWPPPPGSGTDPEQAAKEAALILSTDYLNGLGWNGKRPPGGRLLAWPRFGAVDADGYKVDVDTVPEAVKSACCYLAGVSLDGVDIQPKLERGGRIQSQSVGKLSKTFFNDAANRDVFSALADILRGYVPELDEFAGIANGAGKPKFAIRKVVLG